MNDFKILIYFEHINLPRTLQAQVKQLISDSTSLVDKMRMDCSLIASNKKLILFDIDQSRFIHALQMQHLFAKYFENSILLLFRKHHYVSIGIQKLQKKKYCLRLYVNSIA